MYKLIFKTPSFDLMEDVKKKFGVVFHPNTPIVEIGNKLKEIGYVKNTPKVANAVRQVHNERKGFVTKTVSTKGKEKSYSLETTSN